jgi:hypothetical protein
MEYLHYTRGTPYLLVRRDRLFNFLKPNNIG